MICFMIYTNTKNIIQSRFCGFGSIRLHLKNLLDLSKPCFPCFDLLLNFSPLSFVHDSRLESFDYNGVTHLINLSINYSIAHCLNDPFVNLILLDIK